MKKLCAMAVCALLLFGSAPARADFKYTDTSKITGGSLKSMMKFAGVFSKQASQAMKPMSSTRYVKGNVMRTDDAEGGIEIFDLDRKLVIQIDPKNKTYSQMTFDEIREAIKKATEENKEKMQKENKGKDPQVNMNAKVSATPGVSGRTVNGYTANEMKIEIEMEVTAQQQADGQAAAQPNGPVSGTMVTRIDSWIAPDVTGYAEVTEFYKKMSKEMNWLPSAGINVNPQISQSMQEVQKNQALYKGLPILQYMSMSMAGAQGSSAGNSQSGDSQSSASSNSTPTSPSDALVKGLGGLFGKKKKKDDAPAADANGSSASSNPPPPPSVPGSLMEMTMELSAFSDAKLDPALFTVPAGYTQVAGDPNHVLGRPAKK